MTGIVSGNQQDEARRLISASPNNLTEDIAYILDEANRASRKVMLYNL